MSLSNCQVIGVIFDGDDTLWSTERLYDDARTSVRHEVEKAGLEGAEWEGLERRIDLDNVDLMGYSPERFPESCVQAYEELCRRTGAPIDSQVSERLRILARVVFERDPELIRGAIETLKQLRSSGARLALLTKGDRQIQTQRVARSGLGPLFDSVHIVAEKTPDKIRQVIASLGVDIHCAWMVGNSVRSDLLPALEAGLKAIWVDAHVWEHERTHDHLVGDQVIVAAHLLDLPGIIAA